MTWDRIDLFCGQNTLILIFSSSQSTLKKFAKFKMNQAEVIKGPLSEQEKNRIVFMLGKGFNISRIAREMNRHRKTVSYQKV